MSKFLSVDYIVKMIAKKEEMRNRLQNQIKQIDVEITKLNKILEVME